MMKALCIVLTICLSCSMFETVFEPVVEVVASEEQSVLELDQELRASKKQ